MLEHFSSFVRQSKGTTRVLWWLPSCGDRPSTLVVPLFCKGTFSSYLGYFAPWVISKSCLLEKCNFAAVFSLVFLCQLFHRAIPNGCSKISGHCVKPL